MKNRIRVIAGFAAAAVMLQGLALLFLTPAGIEKIFPLAARLCSEKIEPDSNTYAVYYDMRVNISDADLVVVGADSAVAESFDMLGHFTRFLKQYNNFSEVLVDFNRAGEKLASGMINEKRESIFYNRLDAMKKQVRLSEDYCEYISELFVVNSTVAPVRKFDIDSYSSGVSDLDAPKAQRIAEVFARCERSALCIVDSEELSPGSTFSEELKKLLPGKKIIFINTVYTESCPSPDTHITTAFPLTGSKPSVYFTDNSKLEPFYEYYRSIAGMFGMETDIEDPLDKRFTDTFFVISGGTDVTYYEAEEEAESEAE